MSTSESSVVLFLAGMCAIPVALRVLRMLGAYVIVEEGQCVVFELFGTVRKVIKDPGLHFPWLSVGLFAVLVPVFGHKYVVDLRLDQTYLRSQPVNSEEGAPMGIGVWYEMMVNDPVAFLYKNTDPAGSLRANVSNATVRNLSNLKLDHMLSDRHTMSSTVRDEASKDSREWGYEVGSVYIRKVHFRDVGMIKQIEQKVVNRLRQVTAAIQQDGTNRVNVIRSAAERQAAVDFAKAAAMRPRIVGEALARIADDPEVAQALFEVLETNAMTQTPELMVTMVPPGATVITQPAR